MRAQFNLEWKLFTQNTKNRVIFFFFIILSLYGALVIEENQTPWRSIDPDIFETEIKDAEYFISNNDEYSNPRMFQMFSDLIDNNKELIEAIKNEDWHTVLEKEQDHYINFVFLRYGDGGAYRDPYFYNYDEDTYLSGLRQEYAASYTVKRYSDYQESNVQLSKAIIEERTVIQTILRHLQGWLPAILIIIAILYAVDITPEDGKHLSIVKGVPLSTYKYSWVKSIVVLSGYGLTLIAGFISFAIPIGLKYGLGSFNLPIPVYGWTYSNGDIWINTTIGFMFLQAILLLSLIVLIFIRGMTLLNIFIKQSFINLFFIPFVFISNLWHSPGKTYVHSQYNYIPATYFRIGEALTGQLNHLYLSNLISFQTGLIILVVSVVLIECLLFVGIKAKRHFKGGKYEELF